MATWTIGAVRVTRVEEQIGFASFPPEQYLAGFELELLQRHLPWLVPHHYSPEHDRLVTSVHSWLIRTDRPGRHSRRLLVPRTDACARVRRRPICRILGERRIGRQR